MSSSLTDKSLSVVSWQSAWWTLVSIALNSVLQPSDNFCGQFAGKYSLSVRTSPILSLIDTLMIIGQIVQLWCRIPLRRAISVVARYRRRGNEEPEFENLTLSWRLTALAQASIVRLVAVLQILKLLFGYHGVLGTKIVGATFFASFVAIELMNHFGQPNPNDCSTDRELHKLLSQWSGPKPFRLIMVISCIFSAIFWLGAGSHEWTLPNNIIVGGIIAAVLGFPWAWMGQMVLVILGIFLLLVFVIDFMVPYSMLAYGVLWCITAYRPQTKDYLAAALKTSPTKAVCWTVLMGAAPLNVAHALFLPFYLRITRYFLFGVCLPVAKVAVGGYTGQVPFITRMMPVTILIMATAFSVGLATHRYHLHLYVSLRQRPSEDFLWVYIFHFGANITFGLLCYAWHYVQDGTYKSPWAEYLG